jgi:hypothetical protein
VGVWNALWRQRSTAEQQPMGDAQPDVITTPFKTFLRVSGLPERKARELIANNEVESVRIGKSRYVILDSYRRYLAHLREQDSKKRSGNFGRERRAEHKVSTTTTSTTSNSILLGVRSAKTAGVVPTDNL